MSKMIKYTIFKTEWGYFGLAGANSALLRAHLPARNRGKVKAELLKNLPVAKYDTGYLRSLQKQIIHYYQGHSVNFDPGLPIALDGFSPFARKIMAVCRTIPFGQTSSYGQLAQKIRRPGAARAVGRVISRNRLPLIVPCHRVLAAGGKIGGFSAKGGILLKERMLKFEKTPCP